MNLKQIIEQCDKNSYFSRDNNEVLAAINAAGRFIYDFVLQENRGIWIVFDSSSLVLAVNQELYDLPAGCETLLMVRERLNSADPWKIINPAQNLDRMMELSLQFSTFFSAPDGPVSRFQYWGPYLGQDKVQQDQSIFSLRIDPIPQEAHQVELTFKAQYVDITSDGDYVMIPDVGSLRTALVDLASAELVGKNSDSLAETFKQSGMAKLTMALGTIRANQQQQSTTQETYIDDLD